MATIDLELARSITDQKEKQYGLPSGTLYKMGGIESSFDGSAVSPKGARGFFQFMEPTAKSYGVTIGDFQSEADGAARYMADNLKKYNGNMDLSLADYNGGPKAARALAIGKPYAETSGYLAKFYGGKQPSSLSGQFTTGSEVTPDFGGPSASELYAQSKQQSAEYGGFINGVANLPGAISRGFQVDNSVYNWWQERGLSSVDENFSWTDDKAKAALDGVPQQHWDYILQSKSDAEVQARRARMLDTMEKEQELARMGLAGFSGRLIGGLADLPTLIAFVPGAGGEGLLTAGSRLANAARMGLIGAATNVAFDAATMKYRPTATPDDLYVSAAMGLALGGLAGGAMNPRKLGGHLDAENRALADLGRSEATAAQRAEIMDWSAGRENFNAKLDAMMPAKRDIGPDFQAIDRRIAAGQAADGAIEPAVARIRDEVVPTWDAKLSTRDYPKGIGNTTVSNLIGDLKSSQDPLVAGLASRLEGQLADDIPVVIRKEGTRSFYAPAEHAIHLREDAPDSVKLHEIAHAVTYSKIRYGLANPETAHGELAAQLNDVFKQVQDVAKGKELNAESRYYLKNIDEFVAGIYSGKTEFIDFLANTKLADGHTFLSKAVDIVRKILGLAPNETNALTKALGITDKLIDTPLQLNIQAKNPRTGAVKRVSSLLEPAHEGVDAPTVAAANAAEIPTVFGWGLGLENKLGGAKAPPEVRDLASKLFGTTIGYKDHSVVKANAWDDTTKWADSWAVEMRKGTYPQFEDWMKTSQYKWHEKGKAFDDFGSMVSNYIRGIDADYPPQVIKAGDHMRKTLAKVVDYINNPLIDEGGVKRGLTEVDIRDAEGNITRVGKLEKNPNYLPRKHDVNKWNDMVTSFGREAVEGWWARAYQAGREGVSDEAAQRFAKWYVRTVEEAHANRTQDLLEDIMRGTDKDALRNSLMQNGGFDSVQAQKIIDDMFPTEAKGSSDAGRSSSLKHRNTIDETHVETWTRSDGTKVDVSLNDFIHTNAFDVVEPYLRRTAGNVSLAKHLDVYKNSDIDRMIAEATSNKLGTEFSKPGTLNDYRKNLKFAFDRIQAIPQEEFTGFNKAMQMWRDFNVIRLMGGTVWNQATEMSQIVGSMGWKTTLAAVPELKALSRDIATGKAPHDILDHLENTIGGVGSEYVARMDFRASDDWVRHKGDTKFNQVLDSMDAGTKKFAKGVLDYTGMTPLMIQQKRVHAVALVNHFVNTANGEASKFLTKERLAWMGLDEADTARLMSNLKTFTSPKQGEYGKGYKMDFDGWVKADPESYSKFMTAIHRETRRVIQENDLSSMIPIMGTTLGKTVFQFMNFSMHGWNKSLQFAMNHKDWSTLSTVLHGGLFASLAYMGRTMLEGIGMDGEKRQQFMEQRMSTKQIVANSFGRIAQVSLLPNIYDTVSPYPLFSGMRTTSDLSSLASNPTYQAINGLLSIKKVIRNATSDEYQTTSKDVRTWGKLLPLNNVFPMSTFLNHLANDYPRDEKQQ